MRWNQSRESGEAGDNLMNVVVTIEWSSSMLVISAMSDAADESCDRTRTLGDKLRPLLNGSTRPIAEQCPHHNARIGPHSTMA